MSLTPKMLETLGVKAESHQAVCVCVWVLCAYLVSQKNTEYRVIHSVICREMEPVSIFCVSHCIIRKMCTVHNGSMDSIAAYGITLDASRQMCFSFEGD